MLSYLSKFGDPDKNLNNVFPSSSSLTQFFRIQQDSNQYIHGRVLSPDVLWIVLVGVCSNTAVWPCYEP